MTGRNIRTFLAGAAVLLGVLAAPRASAQHTLGFTAGYGMGTGRFNPQQEMRGMWGMYGGGLTWRYYGRQRFVGGLRRRPRIPAAGLFVRYEHRGG